MCYEVEVVQVVKRSVASLSIVVADAHTALIASDGTSVAEQRAMPSFAPTQIIIDLETGRITNWHKPELADVQTYIRESAHSLAELEQSIAQSKAVFAELEPQSKAIAQRLRDLDGDLPDGYNQGAPAPETAKAQPRQWASSKHFIADLTAANNKQDIGDAAFYLYARLGLVTGIKPVLANGSGGIKGECINLTEQGHALLGSLMLQTSRLDADKWLNDLIEKTADGELILSQQLPSFHVEKQELDTGILVTLEQAQEDTGGRSAVKPRYQHPTTGETWTGRGKQPAWLQAEIAQGAAIDDFLIPAALSLCTLKKPLVQIDIEEQIASETAKDPRLSPHEYLPQDTAPEEVELEDGCRVISVEKRGSRWYAKYSHNSSRSEKSKEAAVRTLMLKLGIGDAECVLMPNQAAADSNTWRYKVSAGMTIDVTPPTYAELIDAIGYAKTTVQAAALVNRINAHRNYEERLRLHDALRIRMAKLQDEESKAHG